MTEVRRAQQQEKDLKLADAAAASRAVNNAAAAKELERQRRKNDPEGRRYAQMKAKELHTSFRDMQVTVR